jgi:hypothetical protein
MLVIEPHVEIAIWALMAAVMVALVMIIIDMVKNYRDEAAPARKPVRNKSPPKKPDDHA